MNDVRSLRCPTCGASLPTNAVGAAWAVCEYCKTPLAIAGAAPPARAPSPATLSTATPAPAEAPGEAAVRVYSVGRSKIGLIKVVRDLTGLGLADAKAVAESEAPIVLRVTRRGANVQAALGELASLGCQYELLSGPPRADVAPMPSGDYFVVLEHAGPNKIAVIKEIREATLYGLKEAKDLAEQTPSRFPVRTQRVPVEEVARRFADAGARVRLERA